ncbi:MAG: hypothetical protein QW727_00720 [Candidatus Pacearchaeota archaeon]
MVKFILINKGNKKKAQAWSLDIIIAMIIFTSGIIMLFIFTINYANQAGNQLDDLLNQGRTASELILNNDESGILSDNIINQTKLENFYNSNYELLKRRLGVKDDFYFTIDNLEINGTQKEYIGRINSTKIENLIKIERISVYKNKLIKFNLYVWK